jgi:hypothetical protein
MSSLLAPDLSAGLWSDFLKLAGDDFNMPVIASGTIYRGPSAIDGAPIVVVAIVRSANSKTGQMVQTYILRDDMDPQTASKTGADVSICGGCVHKGEYDENGMLIPGSRTCYVTLWQGPRVVWEAYQAGKYQDLSTDPDAIASLGFGRLVRLGTYGDPAAVPIHVWHNLLAHSIGHTGYTHQWRSKRLAGAFKGLVMASCDTPEDRIKARREGWGTFTVVPQSFAINGQTFHMGTAPMLCPASKEAGKLTTCADCRKCDGSAKADVFIPAHGATGGKYTGRRALPVMG